MSIRTREQSTEVNAFSERLQEIRQLWENHRALSVIAGWLLGLMTFPIMMLIVDNVGEFMESLAPEAVGIFFTVVILERIAKQQAERENRNQLREQLGSYSNDFAIEAQRQLKKKGLGYRNDKFFIGINLVKAQLQNADFEGVNLRKANLERINLQNGDLITACLQEANLQIANLESTILIKTNMHKSQLRGANMANAKLWFANLQQAVLDRVILINAELMVADLEEASLELSDLQNTRATGANFANANLLGANLTNSLLVDASLIQTNLNYADMTNTHLEGADLFEANLKGAILKGAKLRGAKNIATAEFDESTILPNGEHWNPDKMDYLISLTQEQPDTPDNETSKNDI